MKHFVFIALALILVACKKNEEPRSESGVSRATVRVAVGSDGLTTEQRNIADRLKIDNQPGSVKHLYVLSAYSGQAILYSTVRGKVTSSGKRLNPTRVMDGSKSSDARNGMYVTIGGDRYLTDEVLQDDGTYGSSVEYLYWWDAKGVFHQHYVTGGQIVHISDQPISVGSVTINVEATK